MRSSAEQAVHGNADPLDVDSAQNLRVRATSDYVHYGADSNQELRLADQAEFS